jgi:peptidoglycan hydrolase-like protein with peptidoglycan-binding domain
MRCGVYAYETGEARRLAHGAVLASGRFVCVTALALAVSSVGAEAKKKSNPVEEQILDPANGEPLTLVISLKDQKMDVYRGVTLITTTKVSTGTSSYPTKAGVFSILEKQRYHHSNMYSAAPMPWMQRLTRSGTALHGGVVPGYPASHGCIRLPFSFAPKLFEITTGGENVVVAYDPSKPRFVEHSVLFEPVSPASDANLTEQNSSTADHEVDTSNPTDQETRTETVIRSDDTLVGIVDAGSSAPLRILVTRQTERDRIIAVQYLLSSMGYLTPQKFSGRLGAETVAAIKAFQKANGVRETGSYSDDLAKQVYKVAGKEKLPEGHLFVRQQFRPVFDVPVSFRNPEQTLGTHLFTALFDAGETKPRWMAISLEGDDAMRVLDRIQIPTYVRQKIAEKLTPGSSLIVADKSINSAVLPKGDDFLVSAKDTQVVAQKPEAKTKHAQMAQAKSKGSNRSARTHTLTRTHTLARSDTLARSKTSSRRNTLARNNTSARRNELARSSTWDRELYGFNAPGMDRPRFFRWRWRQCGGVAC